MHRFAADSYLTVNRQRYFKKLTEPDGQQENTGIEEAVLISTCNRTELYCSGTPESQNFIRMQHVLLAAAGLKRTVKRIWRRWTHSADSRIKRHTPPVLRGGGTGLGGAWGRPDFRAGKKCLFSCNGERLYKTTFHCLFQSAVTAAKRMKTDTILSKSSVSTAGLALKTAMEYQQDLPVKNVMIIGASGKIGSIVLKDALDLQGLNILSRQDTNCRTVTRTGHTVYGYSV